MQAMACRFGYTNLEQPLQDIEEVLGEELGMEIIVTRFNLYLNQSVIFFGRKGFSTTSKFAVLRKTTETYLC